MGGDLLFSTHHPVRWGSEKKVEGKKKTFLLGYFKDKEKQTSKIYGDYLNTRKVKDSWFENFKVSYYHKPISSMLDDIRNSGFELIDFLEPKPVIEAKKKEKLFWEIHQKIPLFIIFELKKINSQ